jgi:hypothetical protein
MGKLAEEAGLMTWCVAVNSSTAPSAGDRATTSEPTVPRRRRLSTIAEIPFAFSS